MTPVPDVDLPLSPVPAAAATLPRVAAHATSDRPRLGSVAPPTIMDDDLRWSAVSELSPCPVCGSARRCGVAAFPGGWAVDCSRVVSAWPMTEGGWLHRLRPTGDDDGLLSSEGAACAFPMPSARGKQTETGVASAISPA